MGGRGQDVVWNVLERSLYEWLGLGAVILVSIWLVVRIKARYWGHEDPKAADHQMLMQIGDLRREGQLTDEEYRSIKSRLVERIDDPLREQNNDA